jgi:hypothetical protein
MGYRGRGDSENIWLAWDGEDQAVLGIFFLSKGEELVKHRKAAIVLCHLKPSLFAKAIGPVSSSMPSRSVRARASCERFACRATSFRRIADR